MQKPIREKLEILESTVVSAEWSSSSLELPEWSSSSLELPEWFRSQSDGQLFWEGDVKIIINMFGLVFV